MHKLTTEEFIEACKEVHGTLYSYEKTVYADSRSPVIVTCKVHGDWHPVAYSHKAGKGCQACHLVNVTDGTRKTTEQFIQDAKTVHGEKYDYSKSAYIGARKKITITCPEHGDFEQLASDHTVQGSGCRSCQSCGFNTSKPAKLYILTADNLVKIGITNRKVEDRLRSINKTSGLPFTIHTVKHFDNGAQAADIETAMLRELRADYKQPTTLFDGSTECFYDVSPEALAERIDSAKST